MNYAVFSRLAVTAAAVASISIVTGCDSTETANVQSAHSRRAHTMGEALPTPPADIYFGAYVAYPSSSPSAGQTASFEQNLYRNSGTHMALDMHYGAWDPAKWNIAAWVNDWNNGRVPVLSWNCGDTDSNVANGNDDALLQEANDELNTGEPILVRWFWEMNISPAANKNRTACEDNGTRPVDPTEWMAAYNHIRSVVTQSNVTWVWSPAASPDEYGNMDLYYPGDSAVDWIGIDAYERGGAKTFKQTIDPAYGDIAGSLQSARPILITETGSAGPLAQLGYFQNRVVVTDLKTYYPQIFGFMYYYGDTTGYNWAIPPGTAAWRDFVNTANDPYMSAKFSF